MGHKESNQTNKTPDAWAQLIKDQWERSVLVSDYKLQVVTVVPKVCYHVDTLSAVAGCKLAVVIPCKYEWGK